MSGKPSPGGVAKIVALMRRAKVLQETETRLGPLVAQLQATREEWATNQDQIDQLMRQMDLDSKGGNYGHYDRLSWFLQEMLRQQTEPAHEVLCPECGGPHDYDSGSACPPKVCSPDCPCRIPGFKLPVVR